MHTVFTLGYSHRSMAAREMRELAKNLLKLISAAREELCFKHDWFPLQDICKGLKPNEVGG